MTLTGQQEALLQSLALWDPQTAGRFMPPLLHHRPAQPQLDSSRWCIAGRISLRRRWSYQSCLLPILVMLLLLGIKHELPSGRAPRPADQLLVLLIQVGISKTQDQGQDLWGSRRRTMPKPWPGALPNPALQ